MEGAERALRRLDGVDHVAVDFDEGQGIVRAREGGGFDPTLIARAIRDAGFSAREVTVTARGELVEHEGLSALRLPGPPGLLVLAGGERIDELLDSGLPPGSRIRVAGHLHPSHADEPPGMEVDEWEEVDRPNGKRPSQ